MKIFRLKNNLIVTFSDGVSYRSTDCTDEEFLEIALMSEEELRRELLPEQPELLTVGTIETSKILQVRGNTVVAPSISEVSMPMDIAQAIVKAEAEEDELTLQRYLNFWKLVSMNPDDKVRANIYWFMRRWDVEITQSGLLVAYRNACIKKQGHYTTEDARAIIENYYFVKYKLKKNPEDYALLNLQEGWRLENMPAGETLEDLYNDIMNNAVDMDVYTDAHSGTTTIEIGKPVRMERSQCDDNQEHSCSRGLHLGGKSWLKKSYFGDVGLECLVNPAKIVAIPTMDSYGKLRCCEYYPVGIVEYDNYGDIISRDYTVEYELDVLKDTLLSGEINNEDNNKFNCLSYASREDIYNSYINQIKKTENGSI
jgi:hypothetical protein